MFIVAKRLNIHQHQVIIVRVTVILECSGSNSDICHCQNHDNYKPIFHKL